MVHVKNYETMSKFVKVMLRILYTLFPDTTYNAAFELRAKRKRIPPFTFLAIT